MPTSQYVQYQQSFRPHAQLHTLNGEWRGKTSAQQKAWRNAYKTLHAKIRDRQLQSVDCLQLRTAFDNDKQNGGLLILNRARLNTFLRRCEELRAAYETLSEEAEAVAREWGALRTLERNQGTVQRSLNWARGQAAWNRGIARAARQDAEQMEDEKDDYPLQRDSNGRRRMPAEWLRFDRNQHLYDSVLEAVITAEDVGFTDKRPVEGERWVPQRSFVGGQSTTWLWLKIDGSNLIKDRLLRKDVFLDEQGWVDPLSWHGDIRDPNRTPLEMKITEDMGKVDKLRHSVKLKVPPQPNHIKRNLLYYTMYIRWYPHGDLRELMALNEDAGGVGEPFIWCVAEALTKAGIAMRDGTLDPDKPPGEEWIPVVHRDLKPANVFLEPAIKVARWPDFDIPVLGDYGAACRTTGNDDPMNPRFYRGTGTHGYMAPEQCHYIDYNTLRDMDNISFSEKTNVFGVGLILWDLLHNYPPEQPLWLHNPNAYTDLDIGGPQSGPQTAGYSDELKDLIGSCLRFNPVNRPTFDTMLQDIKDATGRGDDPTTDRSMGFCNGTADAQTIHDYKPDFARDRYQKGLARPDFGT